LANWLFGLLVGHFRSKEAKKAESSAAHLKAKLDRGGGHTSKAIMALMVAFNLGIFFVFKYLNFSILQIDRFFDAGIPATHFVLPIGISFFTFQAMSYVIDIYRGQARAQKNPYKTALYISLFPQLIAGPIVRYVTIQDQIDNRKFKLQDFTRGISRFIIGLSKKVILANAVAMVADQAFTGFDLSTTTVLMVWLGVICYTLQIYFDFSGYSDMAIGLGLMFGFHFEENFNYPYISKSVTEFWRRWHISLGTWFRDYVYFPLGGSRVDSKARLVFNLFVVWTLTGIWHGASWSFVFWGMFYFALLTFEKLTGIIKRLDGHFVLTQFYRVSTLLFVITGWVLFRSENMHDAVDYLGAMFLWWMPSMSGISLTSPDAMYALTQNTIVIIIALIACTPLLKNFLKALYGHFSRPGQAMTIQIVHQTLLAGLFAVAISFTVSSTYNPFIYFNF